MSAATKLLRGLADSLLSHVQQAAHIAGGSAHLDFVVIVVDGRAGAIGGATSLEPDRYARVLAALHKKHGVPHD